MPVSADISAIHACHATEHIYLHTGAQNGVHTDINR
jgi:ribosomal protein L20A (L18A)